MTIEYKFRIPTFEKLYNKVLTINDYDTLSEFVDTELPQADGEVVSLDPEYRNELEIIKEGLLMFICDLDEHAEMYMQTDSGEFVKMVIDFEGYSEGMFADARVDVKVNGGAIDATDFKKHL